MSLRADIRDTCCITGTQVLVDAKRPLFGVRILPVSAVCSAEVVCAISSHTGRVARTCVDLRPLVADGVAGRIVGVGELLRVGLDRAGQRVEAGAQHVDVVQAESATYCSFVVAERPISETNPGQEAIVRNLFQARRIAGIIVTHDLHAGSTVGNRGVGVVNSIRIACVSRSQEALRQQRLPTLWIDHSTR